MSANKHATPTEWIDPDDAPELTDEFFVQADEYVGDCLLEAGIAAANDVLPDRRQFLLSDTDWTSFREALDRPVQSKPRLKKLLSEPGLLD